LNFPILENQEKDVLCELFFFGFGFSENSFLKKKASSFLISKKQLFRNFFKGYN